ncbi:hypothetical protein BVG84_10075 [Serratia marcescens]|nr:hypothetical protein BVG84_10075 [Serratia marcescens]
MNNSQEWQFTETQLVFAAGIRTSHATLLPIVFDCRNESLHLIAAKMAQANMQIIYELYGKWIEQMNGDQVAMLNDRLAI